MEVKIENSGITAGYIGDSAVTAMYSGNILVWAPKSQELIMTFKNIDTGITLGEVIVRESIGRVDGSTQYNASNRTVTSGWTRDGYEITANMWTNPNHYFSFDLEGMFHGVYNVSDHSGDILFSVDFTDTGDFFEVEYDYATGTATIEKNGQPV